MSSCFNAAACTCCHMLCEGMQAAPHTGWYGGPPTAASTTRQSGTPSAHPPAPAHLRDRLELPVARVVAHAGKVVPVDVVDGLVGVQQQALEQLGA